MDPVLLSQLRQSATAGEHAVGEMRPDGAFGRRINVLVGVVVVVALTFAALIGLVFLIG